MVDENSFTECTSGLGKRVWLERGAITFAAFWDKNGRLIVKWPAEADIPESLARFAKDWR